MADIKQPQDHKTKAAKTFTFEGADGETYELPPFATLMENSTLEYGDFLDAVEDGDAGVALFSLRVLNKADLSNETRQALRSLPLARGLQVAGEWQTHGAGVNVPK